MKIIIGILSVGWILASSVVFAAEKNDASMMRANTGGTVEPETANPTIADEDAKAATEDSKDGAATFVDKDGDGINDGKEHRFRTQSQKGKAASRRQMMRKGRQSGKSGSGNSPRMH